jgi:steroid 5-alpha reductase family enzyme
MLWLLSFNVQLGNLPSQSRKLEKQCADLNRARYINTNPLISALAFSIATFPIFLLVTEINKNYSQVDRVWSILPTIYQAHWAIWARLNGLPTQRIDNVLAFSVVWSLRLTYNYWRRGGYQVGSEDYRWLIIKKNIGSVPFFLLNLFFISTLQIVSSPKCLGATLR